MKFSKCETCWKSFIWACPILIHIPKNIISCTAYEPTAVYIKEKELIEKFLKDLRSEIWTYHIIIKWEKILNEI